MVEERGGDRDDCMIRGEIKTVYKNMYQKYADSARRMRMPRS